MAKDKNTKAFGSVEKASKSESKSPINRTISFPKLKISWKEWLPILISTIALIVAYFANTIAKESNKLSIQANSLANQANEIYKDELTLTHRPYVWVENHAVIDEKNAAISNPNTVQLMVINSPAKITFESHRHYMKKGNETTEVEKREFNNRILYPSEKIQYTYTIDQNSAIKINKLLEEGFELFRESKINYQMLSKEEVYKYEANWKFEEESKSWKLTENPIAN